MKYLLFVFVPIIILMTYGGCSDDCVNCVPGLPGNCTLTEDLIDSECLGDTLALSCLGMFCRTDPEVSVPTVIIDCGPVDCETIECGDIVFTDLNLDQNNVLTATVIDDGIDLGNATCGFFQN